MISRRKTPVFNPGWLTQALLNYQIHGNLKEQWFYGAASWAEFGVLMGLGNLAADTLTKKFPDLALEINEFDKQTNLKKLMNLLMTRRKTPGFNLGI